MCSLKELSAVKEAMPTWVARAGNYGVAEAFASGLSLTG